VSFLAAGVLGFFYSSDFSTGEAVARPEGSGLVLGLLEVNGWHNVVHVATGAIALAVARRQGAARAFAIVFGAVYLLVTALGVLADEPRVVLGLLPINTADNVLHAAVALLGLVLGLASPREPAPTTV
jgi:hypothetical protein